MAALPIAGEVERCLPYFIRLCISDLSASGGTLEQCAVAVAEGFIAKIPGTSDARLKAHFETTLWELVDLVAAVAHRLPPDTIREFIGRTSEAEVASTIERSLVKALNAAHS